MAMTCLTQLLGLALLSATLLAESQPFPEYEKERQPGVLRLSGIDDNARVLLDGELIGDGKRIARFGSKLLINPGDYTVTVISSSPRNSCESVVSIRENRTSVVRCITPPPDQLVD
jgi:hypothetical protein